jgi:hypothetical protein
MLLAVLAILCAGFFAGGAIYITMVEPRRASPVARPSPSKRLPLATTGPRSCRPAWQWSGAWPAWPRGPSARGRSLRGGGLADALGAAPCRTQPGMKRSTWQFHLRMLGISHPSK